MKSTKNHASVNFSILKTKLNKTGLSSDIQFSIHQKHRALLKPEAG
jgi:hypothetical protein